MALVNITNVVVLDNPAPFTNPFSFEVTFECIQELADGKHNTPNLNNQYLTTVLLIDLEWKVVYVGNAEDENGDQVLEEVMVGPVPIGVNRFVLQASAPDANKIRNEDLIGVTVILITCLYKGNRFVQIGYYVNNEYSEPFEPENYPSPVDINKLFRNILADQPRVTRYAIDWTGANVDGVAAGAEEVQQVEEEDGEDVSNGRNDVYVGFLMIALFTGTWTLG